MESTPSNVPDAPPADDHKGRKKNRKVRSAWIAFVGRIIAQFVGSAATIVLGLLLLHKYQPAVNVAAAETRGSEDTAERVSTARAYAANNSIAVLPLNNFSKDPADKYIADSMTDVLTAALAQVPGLHVVSGNSPAHFVLKGSVVQAEGRFRVIARLVDTGRDEYVWAAQYDRPLKHILTMEEEIAALVATNVTAIVLQGEEEGVPIVSSK